MVKLVLVQPQFVPFYWDMAKDYIASAVEHSRDETGLDALFGYLASGNMALWVVKADRVYGAAVCELIRYAQKTRVNVVAMGGEQFDTWAEQAQRVLDEWAVRIGADGIEATVREGFVPKLQQLGFEKVAIRMVKDGIGIGK